MACYDYSCGKCGHVEEHTHGMMEKPEFKCPECQTLMEKVFSPNIGGFIFKGGTAAINHRENEYRMKRSKEMAKRQKERYGEPKKIKPNIAGVETGTWENAHKIAQEIKRDTGIIPETYAPLAAAEKKIKIVSA